MKKFSFKFATGIIIVLAVMIAVFISCQPKERKPQIDYTGFTKKEIILTGIDKNYEQKDTLGLLTINIPARLDTFYQWYNRSDCLPCGRLQYRFSDTRYAQFAESGFFWDNISGPIYQLTITHNPIKEAPDNVVIRKFVHTDTGRFGGYLVNEAILCEKISFIKKDFIEINTRPFAVASFISPCSKITDTRNPSLFFTAKTTLKNRYLNFIGECSIKDSTGFLDNMYKTLLSVKIEENKSSE